MDEQAVCTLFIKYWTGKCVNKHRLVTHTQTNMTEHISLCAYCTQGSYIELPGKVLKKGLHPLRNTQQVEDSVPKIIMNITVVLIAGVPDNVVCLHNLTTTRNERNSRAWICELLQTSNKLSIALKTIITSLGRLQTIQSNLNTILKRFIKEI